MAEQDIDSTTVDETNDKQGASDHDQNDLFSTSPATVESSARALKPPVDANENDDLFAVPEDLPAKNEDVDKHVDCSPSKQSQPSVLVADLSTVSLGAPDSASSITPAAAAAAAANTTDTTSADDENTDSLHAIEILVSDPKKIGDGMGAYIVFRVTTRTNIKHFKSSEMVVNRRFSDFLGLHEKLVSRYLSRGIIIPPPPEKSIVGMTKVKVSQDAGSVEFVEKRRAALERFLNRVARHPQLCCDTDFVDFVELDDDLPKSSGTATLSGAGFVRLLNRVGESIGKYTYTMTETDEWFEDKTEQLDMIDHELQQLHASIEFLVINRKDLSAATQQFAKSVAVLGSTEEHMSLSRALSLLSDVETKVYQLHADQADTDFFVMSELVKDYVCVIQSVREVLQERVKVHKTWKDAETALTKKLDERAKLEQQRKMDKIPAVAAEITELEQKVSRSHEDFDEISATIRKEVARFEKQKVRDFKTTIINYLQCMLNYQQQIATCWEAFLPDAKDVE